MTASRGPLLHETAMLAALCALAAWRLTGLPLHEWLAVALGAAVLPHLLRQWPWIATNARRPGIPFLLNLALFLCMAAAIVSGLRISKVIAPGAVQDPAEFLKWRAIHDAVSQALLLLFGLHLSLNWKAMTGALRRTAAPGAFSLRATAGRNGSPLLAISS